MSLSNKKKYEAEYRKKNLAPVRILFKKGTHEIIRQAAEKRDESLTGYIKKAVVEKIKRDNLTV